MSRTSVRIFLLCATAVLAPGAALASPVTIAWSPVGNPGNAADPATGIGAVGYSYSIGTYDVTASQYVTFLNSNDPTGANPVQLYSTLMAIGVHTEFTFDSNAPNGSKYGVVPGDADFPAIGTDWYDAVRFANWVNNGEPVFTTEPTASNNATENGSYTLLGYSPIPTNASSIARNPGATIYLPNENEWYKAAYYDPSTDSYFQWPTSSNTPPTGTTPTAVPNSVNTNFVVDGPTDVGAYMGTTSPCGAFDMGGNVWQWNETYFSEGGFPGYIVNGGSYQNYTNELQVGGVSTSPADNEPPATGFRLVDIPVPEPSSLTLAFLVCCAPLLCVKRIRQIRPA